MDRIFKGAFHVEYATESAGTVITALCPPKKRYKTRLTSLVYEHGSTLHTISLLVPLGETTTSAAAAASQTDMVLTDTSPGALAETLAAADYLVWEDASTNAAQPWLAGFSYDSIASIASSTVTMASNLPAAVSSGAKVWAMYEGGRAASFLLKGKASTRCSYGDPIAGILTTPGRYDPILIHSNNASAAGFIEQASGYYGNL